MSRTLHTGCADAAARSSPRGASQRARLHERSCGDEGRPLRYRPARVVHRRARDDPCAHRRSDPDVSPLWSTEIPRQCHRYQRRLPPWVRRVEARFSHLGVRRGSPTDIERPRGSPGPPAVRSPRRSQHHLQHLWRTLGRRTPIRLRPPRFTDHHPRRQGDPGSWPEEDSGSDLRSVMREEVLAAIGRVRNGRAPVVGYQRGNTTRPACRHRS